MEYDFSQMTTKHCPAKDCRFKNVWQKSVDHHVFYHKDKGDKDPHKEHRERLQKMGWSLDWKYTQT